MFLFYFYFGVFMQELNMVEVEQVGGSQLVQTSGFLYYLLSGGKIKYFDTESGQSYVVQF
jgi:hypothetical protein